ncbi:polyamine aminopropyltransferase [Candidatus Bathyarchaeota archaeon]|nr:polyamine aminopropyltransferase [Candidatus Bathyarchaeota archaeon]
MGDKSKQTLSNWFIEMQAPGSAHLYSILNIHYVGSTKYQEVYILELSELGKALILDGKVQSSLRDEHVYHEVLVQPAMLAHPSPKRVLVIGGGEGATIREVLKHNMVEEVVMVDIDQELIDIVKRYFPELHQGSFNDPRVKLVFDDGRKFVESCESSKFDVVICDLTDPLKGGPSVYLYTVEFYSEVFRILSEDGITAIQAENVRSAGECFQSIYKTVKQVFPITVAYTTFIKSFDAEWGIVLGSKHFNPLDLSEEEEGKRIEERRINLKFYEPRIKKRLFTLPKGFLDGGRISTDSNPIYELV